MKELLKAPGEKVEVDYESQPRLSIAASARSHMWRRYDD
jgi:hypothetical protein